MLVDDEPDNTTVLKLGLERHGYHVDAFNDPREALAAFRPNHYDFNVFDIRMPGMSGFDLAHELWRTDPKARVCFLTAFEIYENEASKVFKDFNFKCFVKKPIAPSELAEHLNNHLTKL